MTFKIDFEFGLILVHKSWSTADRIRAGAFPAAAAGEQRAALVPLFLHI